MTDQPDVVAEYEKATQALIRAWETVLDALADLIDKRQS